MNRSVLVYFCEYKCPEDTKHDNARDIELELSPLAEPGSYHVHCPERQEPKG